MAIALMAAPIRPLELTLLCDRLDEFFSGRILGTGQTDEARRSNFFSKAIAAFVLYENAGASIDEAVAASIDGGFDHGIDSVFVAADQTIWLVQSKYKDTGSGEPDLGEVSKFRDGVFDLLQGRWQRFNAALQARKAAILSALNDQEKEARVRVILVHSGTAISDDRRHIFGEIERAFNGAKSDFLKCYSYGLATLHELHMDGRATPEIEANIILHDFGHTNDPYKAVYGRINAKRLAELWAEHKDHLVERNIRRFKGSTVVNAGLSETLQNEADHFFYFNNGVTFLCERFREQAPIDPYRLSGTFQFKGLSIINGAQTVGAIAQEPMVYYDEHPAEVLATFVCLENAPDDFGDRVTRSRNRQNAVDLEDFAALDERQLVWRQTLEMAGVEYQVKHGDGDTPASNSCFSIRDAAPILACTMTGGDWQEFVVAAKTDKKRLFGRAGLVSEGDSLRDAYFRLFPDSLTARQIWRSVQIGRIVQVKVRDRGNAEADPANLPAGTLQAREILKHGGWLLLHVLFIRTQLQNGAELTLTMNECVELSRVIDEIAQRMVDVVQAAQWNKQARSVFENRADCREVKGRLMAALAQQN